MHAIGVAERGEAVQAALRTFLRLNGFDCDVLPCEKKAQWPLLLCADAEALPPRISVNLLCVPDACAAAAAARCCPETLLTCGLDSRCSLTPSSLLNDCGLATLRRELPLPGGGLLLPCETPLPPGKTPEIRLLLAAAGLVLFSGEMPNRIHTVRAKE